MNLNGRIKKECKKEDSQPTGFEPVRVTPSDFESDALTTRPSQHIEVYTLISKFIRT